jgi:N-carbamoylputrescine amidase
MSTLSVALLQLTSHGYDQAANLEKGDRYCRRAAADGADIALFPELWNVGYQFEVRGPDGTPVDASGDRDWAPNLWKAPERWEGVSRDGDERYPGERAAIERWRAQAISSDGEFVAHFRHLAAELDMAIALTYLEKGEAGPRNTVSLIDRHGEVALTYAKVHTCDFDNPEASLTPGDGFRVCELDTRLGPVKVGAMICYDREFPESARVLMLEGAELVLVPNASRLHPIHLAQLRARAYENMIAIAMTNYPAPKCNGHSVAFHPVAFERGEARDTLVVAAGESESIFVARFDLDGIREYRCRETWGNAFRRPDRYRALTDPRVEPPFVRVDADGTRWDVVRR